MYVDQFGISGTGSGNVSYGCLISPTRIVTLVIVSLGLYWFYWMYRTWKQYRDHTLELAAETGQKHHPVWHGLTQLVPVYGFFRFHAHVRVYKELMQERGVADTLNPQALVTVVVVNMVAAIVAGVMRSPTDASGVSAIGVIGYLITLGTLVVSIWVLNRVQSNLNQYWAAMGGAPAQNARLGKGEVLCAVLGILLWLGVVTDFIA